MALGNILRSVRDNFPKLAYITMTGSGMVFIWVAKTSAWDNTFTIGVCVALMATYFLLAALLGAFRLHDEQAGDNLYYMGFLFTLTSLGVALYRYDPGASVDGIVRDFGLAVVTTIAGIALRILYNQVRRDPVDIERSARHELAEMTRRVRTELDAASREFSNFRRASNQMLEEGFDEISRQAEKSGQQILKIMEALTQEAVKPLAAASQQIQSILEDVGKQTGDRLASSMERMEAATISFEDVNTRMIGTVGSFGDKVEIAATKLAEVKTPDEIISIKLKPTLTALGKLVESHTQRLDVSDDERGRQTSAIIGTHDSIAQLVGSVEKSIAAMEKAVAASAASQRTSEELVRVLQQQHDDLWKHMERVSGDQTQSMVRRIVDDLSSKIPIFATGTQPPGEVPEVQSFSGSIPQAGTAESSSADPRGDKRWWTLR